MAMKAPLLRNIQRLIPWTIALSALAILNGSAWWAYRMSSEEVRENFSRNLLGTARLLAGQVENAYWSEVEDRTLRMSSTANAPVAGTEDLIPAFGDWLIGSGNQLVQGFSSRTNTAETFQDLYLLDRTGAVIATMSGIVEPNADEFGLEGEWRIHPWLAQEDGEEIRAALQLGRSELTPEVMEEGLYYQTAYAPIEFEGRPVGLIGVRANLLFGDRLAEIRSGILVADLIGSLMVVLLTVMFYRVWTGLEKTQNRLLQQERLAELGQMVSGVAHEIRNPLGIIEQTSEMIRRRYAKESGDELLDYIPEEVDRLNRIVTRFLEFARAEPESANKEQEECNLAEEIQKVHSQLLPQARAKEINFSIQIEKESHPVNDLRSDAARQILLNLILNAFDACRPGGKVKVTLESQRGRPRLAVEDDGHGMDPDQSAQALEPFYTTKEKGSGLGLALVAKLAHECGARLEIISQTGQGTRVVISF